VIGPLTALSEFCLICAYVSNWICLALDVELKFEFGGAQILSHMKSDMSVAACPRTLKTLCASEDVSVETCTSELFYLLNVLMTVHHSIQWALDLRT
jgi:hypothetical protein